MSKTNGIIIALVAVIILGGGTYAAMNYHKPVAMQAVTQADSAMKANEARESNGAMKEEAKNDGVMEDNDKVGNDKMMKTGSYEAYSPDKLAKAASGKVVLFFRASWCPSCKAIDTDIKTNLTKIPEQVTILDVDYDNSAALKQKYAVRSQHTFVQVDQNGTMIKTWMGSPSLSALVAEIK